MREPNAAKALDPIWMRFTDPDDAGKYGDRWYVYDESAIMRMRARAQMEIEGELGFPLASMMNGLRHSTALGELAATWLAVRAIDLARAGDFDDFNPLLSMVQWSVVDPAPKDDTAPVEKPSPSMTSVPTDSVALENMPAAE